MFVLCATVKGNPTCTHGCIGIDTLGGIFGAPRGGNWIFKGIVLDIGAAFWVSL